MEALLASNGPQSDVLVGPLKYGLDPQGSYVTSRRQSTTFSNVNVANPESVRVITINCGSASEWMDPKTVLLSFNIKNKDNTNHLYPATPDPACLFSRLQIRLGSTLIEDISEFGKIQDVMTKFSMDPQKRMDHYQLGFGVAPPVASTTTQYSYFDTALQIADKIAPGKSERVYMKFLMSGLFSQDKWLPLFALGGQGLQIQLHLAQAVDAVVVKEDTTPVLNELILSSFT